MRCIVDLLTREGVGIVETVPITDDLPYRNTVHIAKTFRGTADDTYAYPSGFRVGQRVRINREYQGRKYNRHVIPDCDWGIVVTPPNEDFPADAVQVRVNNPANGLFGEGALDAAMLS